MFVGRKFYVFKFFQSVDSKKKFFQNPIQFLWIKQVLKHKQLSYPLGWVCGDLFGPHLSHAFEQTHNSTILTSLSDLPPYIGTTYYSTINNEWYIQHENDAFQSQLGQSYIIDLTGSDVLLIDESCSRVFSSENYRWCTDRKYLPKYHRRSFNQILKLVQNLSKSFKLWVNYEIQGR
jgi:hypothetical protein